LSLTRPRSRIPSIAALLSIGITVLGLVVFGKLPDDGRWAVDVANSAHGPAFALVTLIVIVLLRLTRGHQASPLLDYWFAIAVALLLGTLVELLQLVTGGDTSLDDILRDALGAVAAVGFFALVDSRVRAQPLHRPVRCAGLLVGSVCTAILIAPLAITTAAYLQRHHRFPTLVDFSSPLSTYFLAVYSTVTVAREELPNGMTGGAQRVIGLHTRIAGKNWWGIALREPYPDWRGYEQLALDLANPTDVPLLLRVQIRDRHQRRERQSGYRRSIEIAPHSRRTWTIPLAHLASGEGTARVNTAIVSSIVLSRHPANQATEFYVLRIWLDRAQSETLPTSD
jgi:hypothetical protein